MNATAERFSKICSDFKKYEDAKTLLSDRIDLLKIRIGAH
jgi:hypothetical protein